jgi:hypothetical protein
VLANDVKQIALTVAKDPEASPTERHNARQAITRINSTLAHREKIGRKPSRKNFQAGITGDDEFRAAVNAYRSVLDRIAIEKECGRILDSHGSSPLQRHNARKKLEALNPAPPDDVQHESDEKKASDAPRREDFGFLSDGVDWPEFVAGKEAEFQAALVKWREAAPPPDPKIVAFLNGLNDESFKITKPAPQYVTPKTPITPPIDPSSYCEQCRVPFTVCGCDRVICNLCLRPQADCYPPCQNSRRR